MNNVEFLVQFSTYTAWLTEVPVGHAVLQMRSGNSHIGYHIYKLPEPICMAQPTSNKLDGGNDE